jgi:hypothetical protein
LRCIVTRLGKSEPALGLRENEEANWVKQKTAWKHFVETLRGRPVLINGEVEFLIRETHDIVLAGLYVERMKGQLYHWLGLLY